MKRETRETNILLEPEAVDFVPKVRSGLPLSGFETMSEVLELPEEKFGSLLGISRATLHRRKKAGVLDSQESDRLMRFARLFAKAAEVLGSREAARSWLKAPAFAFHGETPLQYADTETGAREVEALLGRIEYGVFS